MTIHDCVTNHVSITVIEVIFIEPLKFVPNASVVKPALENISL